MRQKAYGKGTVISVDGTKVTLDLESQLIPEEAKDEKGNKITKFVARWLKPKSLPEVGAIVRVIWKVRK